MSVINVLIAEQDGSSRYRLRWPGEALAKQGADVEVVELSSTSGVWMRDCDTVVLNRPVRQGQYEYVEQLKNSGKRVVIDMDDSLDNLATNHAIYGIDTTYLHKACKLADQVVVTTKALSDVYGYGHCTIVPNYVPAWTQDIKPNHQHDEKWVSWYGTVGSHPNDLQSANGGIAKALKDSNSELMYIGPKPERDRVREALKWKGKMQLGGWFSDQQMMFEAISNADVGIVPLANTLFNACKSWLKMVEFASVGVAVIGSPTQPNKEANRLGIGLLANDRNQWYRQLMRLLEEESFRQEVAHRSKEAVKERLILENNVEKFYNAWIG